MIRLPLRQVQAVQRGMQATPGDHRGGLRPVDDVALELEADGADRAPGGERLLDEMAAGALDVARDFQIG